MVEFIEDNSKTGKWRAKEFYNLKPSRFTRATFERTCETGLENLKQKAMSTLAPFGMT
jgi:hypothetical protein